jgi:hypothetical protein
MCDSEQADDIIYCARKNFNISFTGMPKKLQFKCSVEPASRLDEITVEGKKYFFENFLSIFLESGPCNGFVRTYMSLCNYYSVAPNEEICWHFQNLPKSFKVFDLKVRIFQEFSKHYYRDLQKPTQKSHLLRPISDLSFGHCDSTATLTVLSLMVTLVTNNYNLKRLQT